MITENTLFGVRDRVKIAIARLQSFEPKDGYYLAFSGGKDSQCIYHLAKEAGVRFDAHYNLTTLDPPELVYFIRENYPDVMVDKPEMSMWRLIAENGLPTRTRRWCCSILKEHGGEGRISVTGVRWEESVQRSHRKPFEIVTLKKEDKKLFNDNDEDRRLFETCMQKGKRVINPIIDWELEDVWGYIKSRGLKYCKLYDEGWTRIGCIGCPMSGENRIFHFEKYPKYLENYKRAIMKFLPKYIEKCRVNGKKIMGQTADQMMHWWVYGDGSDKVLNDQMEMFADEEEL